MWRSLLILTLCAPALGQRQRDDGVREGDVFRIVPHFANGGALAEAALAAAEASWEHALEAYGVEAQPGRERLRIHLYRSRAEFNDACFRCEGRTWPSHSGLTSGQWGIALVLCGSGLGDEAVRALGLTDHDRELVAHEAAHLIGNAYVPGYAHYPAWLAEGLAESVAVRTFAGEQGRPSIDSRSAWLQELAAQGRLPAIEDVIAGDLEDLEPYHEYALLGLLFEHLKGGELERLRQLQQELIERPWAKVRSVWLDALDLERIGAGFSERLAARQPRWAIGGGSLERDGTRWLVVATERASAAAWRVDGPVAAPFTLGALVSPGKGAVELRVGRRVVQGAEHWVETFLSVVVEAQGVSVERVKRQGSGKEVEETSEVLGQSRGAVTGELTLHVSAAELIVAIDGIERLCVGVAVPRGQWGVGASAGSWGWLRGLAIE